MKPADQKDLHRWYRQQANFFCGCGEIECPVCKEGKLRYARAAYNGHVHAACTNKKCVAWME